MIVVHLRTNMNLCQYLSSIRFYYLIILVALFSNKSTSKENLQLILTGEIKTRCEFSLQRQIKTVNVTNEVSASIPIQLYCNQPMTLEIKSEYGGMKHIKRKLLLAYLLKVDIPNANIDETIPSKYLLSAVQLSSENIPYRADGILSIVLQNGGDFSGVYQDKITMNLAPRLDVHSE